MKTNNENRERLLEELEEARMKLLMDEYAEAEGERLLQEYEEARNKGELPEVPALLDAKCRKIINQSLNEKQKTNIRRAFFRVASKAAACLMILAGIGATLVVSVDALRVPVINYFMEVSSKYTAISFDPNDTEMPSRQSIQQRLKGMPLPVGYELVQLEESESGVMYCRYMNQSNRMIYIEVTPLLGCNGFDTEEAGGAKIQLNGLDAFIYEKEDYRIVWMDAEKEVMFDLYADGVDKDTCLQLAFYLAE